jgi:hypothetical protein
MKYPYNLLLLVITALVISTSSIAQADFSPPETPTAPTISTYVYLPYTISSSSSIISTNIVIDHNSIALFERIPDSYLTAARNLRVLFSDRSVGQNINESLDCLTAISWSQSPASCRRDYYNSSWDWKTYSESDLVSGLVPQRVQFNPNPVKYNRDNWTFEFRMGTWSELTQDFIQSLAPTYINSKDVLSYQFSYLNVDESENIDDPQNGYFTNTPNLYDIYDLEAYIAQHPNKTFIFWTTSLARSIGNSTADTFNAQMRQYVRNHNKILFDIADIESHTDQGSPCYDNRDGIQYCSQTGECENYANDHLNYPAICQDFTTELDGGHLGSVSAGKIQIAKAFWVMMARIAGWDGQTP